MEHVIVTWQAEEYSPTPKGTAWFWSVGIVAAGIAIAAAILQDYLLSVIAVIGGFTVMLVGNAPAPRHTYSVTDAGFRIGRETIPYEKITRFAISEDEPRHLTLETQTLIGVIKAPLHTADFRQIRTEFKNRNIQEEDKLDQMVERVVKTIGL